MVPATMGILIIIFVVAEIKPMMLLDWGYKKRLCKLPNTHVQQDAYSDELFTRF